MWNETFQNANSVFKGQLHQNKELGLDMSRSRKAIPKEDIEKIDSNYFMPFLAAANTEILQQKVFFELMYYTGHHGKEGLRALKKQDFELKISADGKEYIELVINWKTKTNQGDANSSAKDILHNNHEIVDSQPGSDRCPVNTFKHYLNNLQPSIDEFFQRPSKDKKKFDKWARTHLVTRWKPFPKRLS